MNKTLLSRRATLLAVAAASLFTFVVLVSSVATAQIRQTSLYIDDGSGHFAKLQVSGLTSGETLTFPAVNGPANVILSQLTGTQTINSGFTVTGTTDIEGAVTINTTSTLGTSIGNTTGNVAITGQGVDIEDKAAPATYIWLNHDAGTGSVAIGNPGSNGSYNVNIDAGNGNDVYINANTSTAGSAITNIGNGQNTGAVNIGNTTGGTAVTGALNLAGANSPLELQGSVGTSGYVLTSQGSSSTPKWTNPATLGGVLYNVSTAQNTATVGANNLFNVAYNTTDATVAGAVINSATTNAANVSTTGLTVGAASTTAGGSVTGITSSATGGGAVTGTTGHISSNNVTLGIVGLANTSTFSIPNEPNYSDWSTELNGGGAAVVGIDTTDEDNQFAGYFWGDKTNKNTGNGFATGVLTAINDIRSPINGADNGQPAAGYFRSYDNSLTSGTGGEAVPTGVYADSYTGSNLSAAVGVMAHAVTTAVGSVGAQAAGVYSLTVGANTGAATGVRVVGVEGMAAGYANSTYNLIGVYGGEDPYGWGSTGPISAGGYFIGKSATHANLGVVAQVGGNSAEGWQEGDVAITASGSTGKLDGKNVAVVGINYNATPTAANLAGYFGGNVVMTSAPATTVSALSVTNTAAVASNVAATITASGTSATASQTNTALTLSASGETGTGSANVALNISNGTLVYSTEDDALGGGGTTATVSGNTVFAEITGGLTANTAITVTATPTEGQILYIYNATTGAFNLTLGAQTIPPSHTNMFIYHSSSWIWMLD